MFLMSNVTLWSDERDSCGRIPTVDKNKVGYRTFLLNPNRMTDIKDLSTPQIPKASCLFSDNHRDRREQNSFMQLLSSPTEIETAMNTAFASQFITLPFYPRNNPAKTPIDTMIDVDDIAYFDAYNPDPDNYCWVIYNKKAFRRVEQLVGLNINQAEDIAETGTTTTTTTTTEQR